MIPARATVLVLAGLAAGQGPGERDPAELGCTLPGGPGAIVATATDPRTDTTWVAAERGLFMTSPGVDVLDPLDLRDGVPEGRPVGLAVDPAGRLWVATESSFGCIDTRFFYGRVLSRRDGVPPPPYEGLLREESGALLLRGAGGELRYLPDQGPPPELRLESHSLEGDAVTVSLAGRARGGATYRYRHAGRHQWLPLPGPQVRVEGLTPGRRSLEFIAVDRDLRASAPVRLELRVPYPFYYDKRLLLAAVGAAAGALLLLFGLRARGGGRAGLWRALLSAGLALAVGLQVLAGFLGHGRSWPFMGFSMYTETYREGSVLYKAGIVGIRPDGSRIAVSAGAAGLPSDGYWQGVVPLIHGGEEARRRFLSAYNDRHPEAPLRGFRVQTERFRLTREGPVAVAPVVLAAFEGKGGGGH